MRTILRLKQFIFVLLSVTLLNSCLKSDDPDFAITYASCVVLQKNIIDGDQVEKRFLPHIQIIANEAMESYTCQGPEGILSMESMPDSYGQGAQSKILNSQFSTTFPKGNYRVSVKNAKQEIAGWSVDIKDTEKVLGTIEATISYENGRVKAKWNKVENASFYLVGIGTKGEPYSLINGKKFTDSPESGVDFAISDISAGFTKGEYQLVVRAVQSEAGIVLDSESVIITLD
ncbi:hypothetical protein [Gabonibacter massiliensis]|uniref:hypothetical protein n=1 Tax=Gabonibacter massiliensis TaxID=1720195 RepID=UPI00073ED560|nr:hypothetical protein [Gabonibacter massiliensis]